MTRDELLAAAREAALRAHCPYSHFRVGTAVLAGGKAYVGVNIEISSYGLTLCAERSALAAAISAGAGPNVLHTGGAHPRTYALRRLSSMACGTRSECHYLS